MRGSLFDVMNPQAKNRVVTAVKARNVRRLSWSIGHLRRLRPLQRKVATEPLGSAIR